jgi:hypothetical protein
VEEEALAGLPDEVEVSATGWVHSEDGRAWFQLQTATAAGVPVPKALLQHLLTYYSRSPQFPSGLRLDAAVELPARIKEIHVREGEAVVLQQ